VKSRFLTLLLLCYCVVEWAQTAPPLPVGSPLPSFCLTGTDGVVHCAKDWKGSAIFVVAFLSNHCTESQVYEARLNKLAQDYASRGVKVVAIQSSNPQAFSGQDLAWSDVGESLADMEVRAAFRKFRFPYLFDGDTGATARAFGAIYAPSIYVFDKERKLRYTGRVDDDPTDGPSTQHDAAAAIDALLAGNPVPLPITAGRGCALRLGAKRSDNKEDDDGPVSVSLAPAEVLSSLRRNPTSKLLLVNFYATWCGPCVTEFPDLIATNRMYRGRSFAMTTVSSNVPQEKPEVLKFLQKMQATTNNLLYGSDDTYAMQAAFDPDVGSAVPVTVLIGTDGRLLLDEQGEIDLMEIRRAILANLPDDPGHEGSQKYWSTK
jgi:thiol-disulfide isomerase/thioredoxin